VTELGRGALGPLFAARVAAGGEEGRLVAVRRIPVDACAPQDVERLLEAARIARRVRHSKLAAVLDVVEGESEIALVGEYVDGRSLSSLQRLAFAKRSPMPPAVALRIGLEVLHGLRAARETWKATAPASAGAAPRGGLSPDCVFVAAFGEVLLSEIGVSAVASTLVPFRELPAILAYRSPEDRGGNGAAAIDERADVFSVGVTLWELLANRPLFGEAERMESPPDGRDAALADRILRDIQSKLIPPLGSTERNGAPIARAAVEIVERALRRDPATRFTGVDQMLGALLALNREFLASADQVRVAIESLAGAEIAAQRATLGSLSSVRPSPGSSPTPDSNRPTLRPQPSQAPVAAPERATSPRDSFSPQPPPVEQFSTHEAPTYPSAQPGAVPAAGAGKPGAPSGSRSLPLPRLPKVARASSTPPPPPVRSARPTSTPPPPPVRSTHPASTPPPPPARKALPTSTPQPPVRDARPASTEPAPGDPMLAPPTPAAPPSSIPPAFGDPLPPLPDFSEVAALRAVDVAAPPAQAPIPEPAPALADRGSTAPAARDSAPPRRRRARRLAVMVGSAVALVGLLGLLRALLRPKTTVDSVATPPSVETRALSASAPAALPAPEAVTQAPPEAPATASAAVPSRENQTPAPTKAEGNANPAPPPAPPRESHRPPETRPEPQRKPFRPRGI
jgi:serine/threonine protein kinase